MSHALPKIAFPQLLAHEPRHHAFDPLLADDGILRGFEPRGVVVVDAREGGRDSGFFGKELRGFGGWHGGLGFGGFVGDGMGNC